MHLLKKQHLKYVDEIKAERSVDNSNATDVAKTKSTPTSASLQAVVRITNGKNSSVQHEVSLFCMKFVSNSLLLNFIMAVCLLYFNFYSPSEPMSLTHSAAHPQPWSHRM